VNIEAYDAESLRKLVRTLEYENRILKDKLKKENIPYDEVNPFEEIIDSVEEYDPDQGGRIVNPSFITEKMATHFFSMFWGREDVYAKRGKNGGYFPQCDPPGGSRRDHGRGDVLCRCAAAELHGFEYRRLPRRADRGGRCVRDFRRGSAVHHVRGLYAAAEGRKNCKNPAYQTKNMNLPLAKETKV
jgi:hypothetical protein